jgi:hypothetical protein
MRTLLAGIQVGALPACAVVTGSVPGRSGSLAMQAGGIIPS